MPSRHSFFLWPLLAVCLTVASFGAENSGGVPANRLNRLRRGINASEWFAQETTGKGYTPEHLKTHTTAQDMTLIRSLGFDHVRLSIDPAPLFHPGHANTLPADYLVSLDAAVKMILDADLAVVLDLHPESSFKSRLAKEDAFVEQFVDFWRTLARHYASWDANRVFFEILNEPEGSDRYRWMGIQAKVAAAIREVDPQHTILATGAHWSADDELVFLEALHDQNVVYVFHFYEPHIFTHQGATWGSYFWVWVKGLPYPSTPESAARVADQVPDSLARLFVARYGQEHWNAERVEAEVGQVAAWAEQRNVPVVCNEFGVYRAFASPQDRARWIHDVRSALERHGIGWAMWDYAGSFGVVTKKDGQIVPDDAILRALGLR
jgi:aryl-phospho-beta-D-glucosidase BglC (GH1 family)